MSTKTSVCLLAAALLLATQVFLFRGFMVDDTFITLRYVRQWTHGHGLVYNIGEQVEGYSNFLWVVLLAPFDLLKFDLVLAAKGLGILFSVLTLGLTWRFSRSLLDHSIAPLWLAASGSFAAWSVGGLETALFTCLLTASVYAFVREEATDKSGLSGILFGLLCLARPEGALFALVAAGYRCWSLYRTRARPAQRDWIRLASLAAFVLPYLTWRIVYYGYPLPNTVYAKAMGLHPRSLLEGLLYLYETFTVVGGFFFVALPVVLALAARPRHLWVTFLAANIAAYELFVVVGGGDWMPMQRFAVHILPLLYLLVQAGLEQITQAGSSRWRFTLLSILVWGQAAYLSAGSLDQRFVRGIGSGPIVPQGDQRMVFLWQHVSPTDTIAVIDAGFNAYRLPLETRVVDMVGLTNAHIAHQPVQLPGGVFGRGDAFGKWDVSYVLDQNPRFVQVNLTGQTQSGEWRTNFTGTTLLVNDPRFRAMYHPVDEPGTEGIFVRNSPPQRPETTR